MLITTRLQLKFGVYYFLMPRRRPELTQTVWTPPVQADSMPGGGVHKGRLTEATPDCLQPFLPASSHWVPRAGTGLSLQNGAFPGSQEAWCPPGANTSAALSDPLSGADSEALLPDPQVLSPPL